MCTQGRGLRPSNPVYFLDKFRILLHTWEMVLDHEMTNQLDRGRYVINSITECTVSSNQITACRSSTCTIACTLYWHIPWTYSTRIIFIYRVTYTDMCVPNTFSSGIRVTEHPTLGIISTRISPTEHSGYF